MKNIILAVLLVGITGVCLADPQVILARANRAYSAGSFDSAAILYKKVADDGYAAPELYYNLGNAFFKMNDMAHAVLWYERALRLDPGNEDINFNLNVANARISDKIEPVPEMFYKRWFNGLLQAFSYDTWALIALLALILSLSGFVMYLASHVLILRKAGFWAGCSLAVLVLFTLSFAWAGYGNAHDESGAIVFAPTITVKSSPDEKGTDLFVLHEGTKVQLLDQIGGWYEIRIANGSVGWLPSTAFEKI
jgi:tetratricopeptide (TPR) repeat protein